MCFFSLICCKKSWIPTLSFAIKSGWDRCLKHSKSNNRLLVSIFFESLPSRPYKWERAKTRKKTIRKLLHNVWPKKWGSPMRPMSELKSLNSLDLMYLYSSLTGPGSLPWLIKKINTPPQHTLHRAVSKLKIPDRCRKKFSWIGVSVWWGLIQFFRKTFTL